jgi:hypothetical protein
MPQDDNAPVPTSRVDIPRELAMVPVPAGGQDTQLEQFREMQAKLDEEGGRLVQLRQNIEQEWADRALAGGAPHWARDVQCRIVDDARAGLPPAFSGVGQNLAAAAYSERCRSHPPPRGVVSRANSRVSWKTQRSDEPRALPPEGKGAPRSIAQRPPNSCGRPRSAPGACGTGRLQPRIASTTSTTAVTVEPASKRRCAEATTPGAEDATTVRRTGAPRPNCQVRGSSVGPYDGRRSQLGSEPRLPSPSTQGRQGRSCGLRIIDWHASWEGRMTTTSSSATSPFSSSTLPEHGWSICLLRRSPTRTTWSRPSRETSKVRTCALGTHGISEAAASSQRNPCESTSDGFQSSAPSCPTSPTRTSSGHSSSAPRAGIW